MKATLRENGHMRITINIKQHISLYDIQEAILSEQKYNEDGSFKSFKGRKEILEIVKTHFTLYGCEIDYAIDEDMRNEFEQKALQNAIKLFPEMQNEELK